MTFRHNQKASRTTQHYLVVNRSGKREVEWCSMARKGVVILDPWQLVLGGCRFVIFPTILRWPLDCHRPQKNTASAGYDRSQPLLVSFTETQTSVLGIWWNMAFVPSSKQQWWVWNSYMRQLRTLRALFVMTQRVLFIHPCKVRTAWNPAFSA